MYESINMAAHALNRKLGKYKERRMDGYHGGAAMSDDLMRALDSLEEFNMNDSYDQEQDTFVDPDAVKVTKVNSFNLKTPMSQKEVRSILDCTSFQFDFFQSLLLQIISYTFSSLSQQAIFALDYIDHDFFVYLSEETNNISVVYKRHVGGVGLIEP
jgi:putative sigma-54 modulation protein